MKQASAPKQASQTNQNIWWWSDYGQVQLRFSGNLPKNEVTRRLIEHNVRENGNN